MSLYLSTANKPSPKVIHRRLGDFGSRGIIYVIKIFFPESTELYVRGRWYNFSMNTIDESFLCSTCGEQYAYCGCPNEDSAPFSNVRPCQNCGFEATVLFQFAGDRTERCVFCHNNARFVGVSTTEADWF